MSGPQDGKRSGRPAAAHAAALLAHAGIVWWWLHPIVRDMSAALPGTHAADNVTFVWNLWWMRYVLHHPGLSFFSTSFLFYPVGTDLTLHTHTALPALVAAVAGPASLIASQNLLILAHLFLNFACSYALACRLTRHAGAAFTASIVFGASPFIGAHLPGHFNLIAAWTLPLVVLLWHEAAQRASPIFAALCGLALGATAYIDYYLFIYTVVLLVGSSVVRRTEMVARPAASPWIARVTKTIGVLLVLDLVVIAGILLARTDRLVIGPLRISLRTVSNPITAAWLLLAVAAGVLVLGRFRPSIRTSHVSPAFRIPAIVGGVALFVLLPLVVNGARLWRQGHYVSQEYRWRSAPAGVDVGTLVLGPPFNVWWGGRARRSYSAVGIDAVESVGWIPLGGLVLAGIAMSARRQDAAVREWVVVGAAFFLWALGPWVTLFGRQLPLLLPAILVRYVPLVANARMPGRAMVVVYLACGLLAAHGVTRLLAYGTRGRVAAWAIAILIAIDCAPASPPVFAPRIPVRYAALTGGPGAVCELPLGLRDGFGEIGKFDSMVLLQQTVHERPLLGGFVARLPPDVASAYASMPVIGTFLRLSSGGRLSEEPTADAVAASARLASSGILYIVVNTRTAPADLMEYVRTRLSLQLIAEEDGRTFYEVSR